jgi:hypothetical protein
VNELGVFAMTETGLKGVSNPSKLFLSNHNKAVPGSCVLATLEGTRPLLVRSRRWSIRRTRRTRAGCRSAWKPTAWPCCSRCCTGTRVSRPGSRTCS